MATRFVPNPAFRRELEAEPEFVNGVTFVTEEVAVSIQTAAEPFRHTGRTIRAMQTRPQRIYLEPHFGHLAELGSVNNPPQANVRRGVKAAGLRFADDGPKQAD